MKFSILLIACYACFQCTNNYKIIDYSSENQSINENLSTNNFSEFRIDSYRDTMESQMNKILNTSEKILETGCPEGLLGNFVADLTLLTIKKELPASSYFCVLNNGGFRTSLPAGNISRGKIYEIMPFDNEIVILELNEELMIELFNFIKNKSLMKNSRKSGVPVSGLRMRITGTKISRIFIGIEEYDSTRKYKLVTTDYLANGGGEMSFLKRATNIEHTGILLRDAIIDYIVMLKNQNIKVSAEYDGRIYHAE